MEDPRLAEAVERVIRGRKTEKVLGDLDAEPGAPDAAGGRETVLGALRAAGWAPFHYPRGVNGIAEPWRAHVLWRDDARALGRYLRDDLRVANKLPNLAAGCDALVLVTWLPETEESEIPNAARRARDEEHLAAAAAMVQNLLLLLTAHGMGTYWSSGGQLREPAARERLRIPAGERLLAAVFVEYPESRGAEKERVPGKLRDRRGDAWIREASR